MELFLGALSTIFLTIGTWATKKVIEHDRILSVRDEKLEQVLSKVEDIRAYLRDNKPLV